MKRYLGFTALVLVLATVACTASFGANAIRGSGDVVEEERPVSGFSGIQVSNQGDAIIELGETESLVVEAEDNLLEYIVTEVRGDTLVLATENNVNLNNTRPIRYHVTVKALDDIEVNSTGNVTAPDLEANTFNIQINSTGNVDLDGLEADTFNIQISSTGNVDLGGLEANRLEVGISSSGNVDIGGGQVENQDISISSSGEYDARDMDSRQAEVNLSSSGDAHIRVSEHLQANLSSSGSVYYTGDPEVDARETSSGRVNQRGE